MKIKTIEQAEKLGLYNISYPNGDWKYEDTDGYEHLFRNGKELLPEVKKAYVDSYENGDWIYLDTDGHYHIFRNGKEIAKGLDIYSYDNGDWEYIDTKGKWNILKGDNNE